MRRGKTINKSAIQGIAFPKAIFDPEVAAELLESLKHTHLFEKESGSLTMSTLLINKSNVVSFQKIGVIRAIINSIMTLKQFNQESMVFIRSSIDSLTILIDTDVTLRQQLLTDKEGIFCLFKLCHFLAHHDLTLQLNCFELILLLSKMDNSISEFHKAGICNYLVSEELLIHEKVHKVIHRGSSELILQLLLFDPNFVTIEKIEGICFEYIEKGLVSIRDDITERNIFNAVIYILSCGRAKSTKSACKVLLYCIFIIRTQRIVDLPHLLLLLKCLHECINLDIEHNHIAVNNQIFPILLYSCNYEYWSNWLHKLVANTQQGTYENLTTVDTLVLGMKSAHFQRPPEIEPNHIVLALLLPKLVDIVTESVEIYIDILKKHPRLCVTVLSSGLISSVQANPIYTFADSHYEFPKATLVHLTHEILLISLANQSTDNVRQNSISVRFLHVLQDLLLVDRKQEYSHQSTEEIHDVSAALLGVGVDLPMLSRLFEVQGIVDIIIDIIVASPQLDILNEAVVAFPILYLNIDRCRITDSFVLQLTGLSLKNKRLFFSCISIICMHILTATLDVEKMVRSSNLLYVLVAALKIPVNKFAHKNMVLSCLCLLSSASDFLTELRASDTDAIPFIIIEMQRKSLKRRRKDNEDVEGYMNLMRLLQHDMAVMRMQSLVRGIIGRRHRLAQMLLTKRQQKDLAGVVRKAMQREESSV